jgi:hypothetical protein
MHTVFLNQQHDEAAIIAPRTADIAFGFLRNDLQNALQINADNTSVLVGTFEGVQGNDDRGKDADDLIFFTTSDSPDHASANGDVKKVELCVEVPSGTSDHALVRRVTRNLLSQVDATPDEEILCRHVGGFNLRYFDGSAWQDSWDSTAKTNAVPTAVEVTLTLEETDLTPSITYTRVFAVPCSTTATSGLNLGGG